MYVDRITGIEVISVSGNNSIGFYVLKGDHCYYEHEPITVGSRIFMSSQFIDLFRQGIASKFVINNGTILPLIW